MNFVLKIWNVLASFVSNAFQKIKLTVRVLSAIRTIHGSFPGVDDSDKLREWCRYFCKNASVLALSTDIQVDDKICAALSNVVESDAAWRVLYALIVRAATVSDAVGDESQVVIPVNGGMPELTISGIGILLAFVRTICAFKKKG